MKTVFIALRAILYAAGFILLWGWLARFIRKYDAPLGIRLPAWLAPAGWPLAVAGALAGLSCLGAFVLQGRGTAAPFDPPRDFVAAGPYRFVRNPMYLSGGLLLAGYGLTQRSGAILLLAAALLGIAHLFVVLVEEPDLAERFGASYGDYRATTNRWIPRRPRRAS